MDTIRTARGIFNTHQPIAQSIHYHASSHARNLEYLRVTAYPKIPLLYLSALHAGAVRIPEQSTTEAIYIGSSFFSSSFLFLILSFSSHNQPAEPGASVPTTFKTRPLQSGVSARQSVPPD